MVNKNRGTGVPAVLPYRAVLDGGRQRAAAATLTGNEMNMKRMIRFFAAACVFLAASSAAWAAGGERAETLDLRTIEGNVVSLSKDALVLAVGGKSQSVPVADLESVFLRDAEDLSARTGAWVVQTAAGDLLVVDKLSASDGKVRFASAMIGDVELPYASVSCVYLPGSGQTVGANQKRVAEVPAPGKPTDMLIVDQGKEYIGIEGVLVSVQDLKVTFRMGTEDRQIETRHVKAIRLATAGPASAAAPAGRLLCADGSELPFSAVTLEGEKLSLASPSVGTVTVLRKNVAAIRFTSGRATALSSLTPAEVEEHGLFDMKFPHRKDRSVGGGPLVLAGKTYASGIGMNSFTQLTYKIEGQYKTFVAVVGIDDSARPQGNATLTFLGDGKELAKPLTLTGKDAPQPVRLDLSGVKSFIIRVDFGPDNLPVGDHVDLCSARLIK